MWLLMLSNDPWGSEEARCETDKNLIELQAITRKSVARIDTRNGVIRNRHAGHAKQKTLQMRNAKFDQADNMRA